MQRIKTEFDNLDSLTNIEFASKVLIGALYRQVEMHPIDYIYNAINAKIEHISSSTAEYEVIEKYVKTTTTDAQINFDTHKLKVFRIDRKGEAEDINAFKKFGNRRLLFHGSSLFNFIGILSQGLRIAPPEAPATGYLFGKGVYFADMFAKSYQYSAGRVRG